jgi:hypothetical protein
MIHLPPGLHEIVQGAKVVGKAVVIAVKDVIEFIVGVFEKI